MNIFQSNKSLVDRMGHDFQEKNSPENIMNFFLKKDFERFAKVTCDGLETRLPVHITQFPPQNRWINRLEFVYVFGNIRLNKKTP